MHVANLLQDRKGGRLNCCETRHHCSCIPIAPSLDHILWAARSPHNVCYTAHRIRCIRSPTQQVGWQINECKDWFPTCSPMNAYYLQCSHYYLASKMVTAGYSNNAILTKQRTDHIQQWQNQAASGDSLPVLLKRAGAYHCSLISCYEFFRFIILLHITSVLTKLPALTSQTTTFRKSWFYLMYLLLPSGVANFHITTHD